MTSFRPDFTLGNFIPENYTIPQNKEEFELFLKNVLEKQSRLINRKDTGQYETVETQNNQTYPGATPQAKRNIFRKIISTGTLPNAAPSAGIPHGIAGVANTWMFTRIYGFAMNPATPLWIPMPNAGPLYQVQIEIGAVNIVLTTAVNLNAFTTSYVVLEYYKS